MSKDLNKDVQNEGEELDNIITLNDEDGNEVKMTESIDYGEEDLTPLIEGEDYRYNKDESFESAGYSEASDISDAIGESDDYEEELNLDALKF